MNSALYYDGSCPLCNKEVATLKRWTKGKLDFVDVHTVNDETLPSKDQLLKRLHLRKANGEWLLGLDANVYAWSQTRFGVVFKVLRVWPLRTFADAIYNRWADKRFQSRYACKRCIP